MSTFRKCYGGIVEAIVTNAVVVPAFDVTEKTISRHCYTENAVWDTGAQFTVISPRLVDKMQLKPRSEGEIIGIGGDHTAKTYMIHLGLPSGDLVQDVEVYCSDIDDYDVLIGMDIIGLTDFCLTNSDGKTVFAYRIPSEGRIDF